MKTFFIFFLLTFLTACQTVPYKEAISTWSSHEDVAAWLDNNFTFDHGRSEEVAMRMKRQGGASGLLVRNPEKLYNSGYGYCVDAANFALENLNRINTNYNARWVFISNDLGRPHHWVTAFDYNGKLYIMDYGTGSLWRPIPPVTNHSR